MTRFTIAICTWWLGMAGIAAAQSPAGMAAGGDGKSPPVKTVAAPPRSSVEILPPAPPPVAPAIARRGPDDP